MIGAFLSRLPPVRATILDWYVPLQKPSSYTPVTMETSVWLWINQMSWDRCLAIFNKHIPPHSWITRTPEEA